MHGESETHRRINSNVVQGRLNMHVVSNRRNATEYQLSFYPFDSRQTADPPETESVRANPNQYLH
jgi:hypothetical protein